MTTRGQKRTNDSAVASESGAVIDMLTQNNTEAINLESGSDPSRAKDTVGKKPDQHQPIDEATEPTKGKDAIKNPVVLATDPAKAKDQSKQMSSINLTDVSRRPVELSIFIFKIVFS